LTSRTLIPKTPFSNAAAFLTPPTQHNASQSFSLSLSKSSQLQIHVLGFKHKSSPFPSPTRNVPNPKTIIQSILRTTGVIGAIVLFFISTRPLVESFLPSPPIPSSCCYAHSHIT
jgi:hypothetical protein